MSENHSCCPKNSLPKCPLSFEGKGKIEFIGGYDNYIIGDSPKTILYFYDIYGQTGGRTKQVCDQIASLGYTVVMSDPLKGDYWKEEAPVGEECFKWISTKRLEDFEKYVVNFLIPELSSRGSTEFAVMGTCYGVWVATRIAALTQEIKAVVGFHPSLQIEDMHGGSSKSLIEKTNQPTLYFPASNDPDSIKPNGEFINILQSKNNGKTESYPKESVVHGYVCRGDLNDPTILKAYDETIHETTVFLQKHF